jgi:hypothetical protein
MANYFKHRDDWKHDAWTSEGERREVKTRTIVERMGIIEFSTGNMRTGFEFFEIDPYWSCKELGAPTQELAKAVYAAQSVILPLRSQLSIGRFRRT